MNTTVKCKNYKFIQKIGYILLIIASATTLAEVFNVFEAIHFIKEDLRNYIFLIGGLLILLPDISKRTKDNSV